MTAQRRPSLALCGLSIDVVGWEFPKSSDWDNGNWIVVDVLCRSGTSQVSFGDPCLRTTEMFEFRDALSAMVHAKATEAELNCVEPGLHVDVKTSGALGHLDVTATLMPDPLEQRHVFKFHADQSHLQQWISDCDRILQSFSIRGSIDVL